MSGILANSASKVMVSGDTSADNALSGWVTGEQVSLSVTPTGTTYQWSCAIPSASAPARSALDDATSATPKFFPDVAGYYTVSCIVDSTTTYVLRMSVVQSAIADPVQGERFSPVTDAQIQAPPLGGTLYYSSDQGAFVIKWPDGSIGRFGSSISIGGVLNDANQNVDVADGTIWTIPDCSGDNVYTLITTNAVSPDMLAIECRNSSGFSPTIVNGGPGGGTLVTPANGYGYIFGFNGTNYVYSGRYGLA
jgi:hypothetical protein